MLRRLQSTDERFKTVIFKPGRNLLIADMTEASSPTDSRNGVGKSSVIEVLHFVLGMGRLDGSVLENPALPESTFTLVMDWPGVADLSVSRSLKQRRRSRIELAPDVISTGTLPSPPGVATVPEWVSALGYGLFGFPEEHEGIGARALLSLYMRRVSRRSMDDPIKSFPAQTIAEATTNVAYLLGLDWRLASRYQHLASRESLRRKLKQATKDPAFGLVVGTVSELRGQVAAATVRVHRLADQVASFRVVPEYEQLQARADEIDARIRGTRIEDAADRRNLQDLQAALRDEREPATDYLRRVYRELGVLLPEAVTRRYDDVRAFHESVVANRRAYLEEEIDSTSDRLAMREEVRTSLGEKHADLLRALHEGGALDAFTALQQQLSIARSDLETLKTRFEVAKRLEATQAEINAERSKLRQLITRDLDEREALITEINTLFQQFAATLYGTDRDSYVDISGLDKSLHISPHIGGEDSQGISKMVTLCFDLTCAVLAHRNGRGPDFLVHDSHLFDGVDERQIGKALRLARAVCADEGLQYIVTMNSDDLAKAERYDDTLSEDVIEPRLTDHLDDGGLFGFRFEKCS